MLISLIGLFSGILSGMGIGGGMILIPSLTILAHLNQHAAQSVNLYYFVPTALAALIIHIKNKNIDKKAALPMILWGVPFSLLGAFLALKLSESFLKKLFASFILIFGIIEILKALKALKNTKNPLKRIDIH